MNDRLLHNGKPSTVTIRHELTPLSLDLLSKLRKSRDALKIKYIWAGKDGNIYVRENDKAKPVIIKNQNDLNRYVVQQSSLNKLSSCKRKFSANICN